MNFTVLRTKVSVSPLFFAVLTLFLLIDKNGIASVSVLFSFLHEIGHFLALLSVKSYPGEIVFSVFGMHIFLKENLSTAKKGIVLGAGFSLNFMLSLLFFVLDKPLFGYINLIIGFFTALPLVSTDGGGILKILLDEFIPEKAERFFEIITKTFAFVFSTVFIITAVYTENWFILIAVIYTIVCIKKPA